MNMEEDYILTTDAEEDDVRSFPDLANTAGSVFGEGPGMMAGLEASKDETWSITEGLGKVGRSHAGAAGLVTELADYDEVVLAKKGAFPLPVYAKRVATTDGNVVALSELTGGEWQAATVASCTLPDGTRLALKLHTSRNGDTLHFQLVTGAGYY